MLNEIFGEHKTKRKIEINGMLKDLYEKKGYEIRRALQHHSLELGTEQIEKLIVLVTEVRCGREPVYFEIDENNFIRYWYAKNLEGDSCVAMRIGSKEEWDKAVDYMVGYYRVDRGWGCIEEGIRKFTEPGIYLFSPVARKSVNDNPNSNFFGSKSVHTFLRVQSYKKLRKEALEIIAGIKKGELKPVRGFTDE